MFKNRVPQILELRDENAKQPGIVRTVLPSLRRILESDGTKLPLHVLVLLLLQVCKWQLNSNC
jgi:hypothetical protein